MPDSRTSLADRILDTAMELARKSSWERLYLHQVAESLGISLVDLHRHFVVKDDLVEAWYDRADRAMLHAADAAGFSSLSVRERLHRLVMTWLDFLAMQRTVSRDMLLYKLEPAHIHLQLQGLLRVSRTVQWLREAARLDSSHLRRIAEEIGLTAIFLSTFTHWMFDSSENQAQTRDFLDQRLAQAERLLAAGFGDTTAGSGAPPAAGPAPPQV